MAACHLPEHRGASPLHLLVIRQLRALGQSRPPATPCPATRSPATSDDFLADLANANRPRNTIRAYRGDLIGFASHHDGEIAELRAFRLAWPSASVSGPRHR